MSKFYPIYLDVKDKKCVIVGGGKVAYRKVCSLKEAGAEVVVVSPETCPEIADKKDIALIKKDYDEKKLSKQEVEEVKKESGAFIKFLVEYMQRKRGRELERAKIRVKHGSRYGEVILLGEDAFIIHDIDNEEKELSKAKIKPDGSLGTVEKSSLEELEKALAKIEIPPKGFIKEPIFEDLKRVFGKDVEVLVNY